MPPPAFEDLQGQEDSPCYRRRLPEGHQRITESDSNIKTLEPTGPIHEGPMPMAPPRYEELTGNKGQPPVYTRCPRPMERWADGQLNEAGHSDSEAEEETMN